MARRVHYGYTTISTECLIPTPDDWAPAVFVDESHVANATHETQQDQSDYEWQGHAARSAFDRDRGGSTQYTRGAYVRGKVYLWTEEGTDGTYMIRVCFWGDDDTGLELDLRVAGREAADDTYRRWSGWMGRLAYASYGDLLKIGFVCA